MVEKEGHWHLSTVKWGPYPCPCPQWDQCDCVDCCLRMLIASDWEESQNLTLACNKSITLEKAKTDDPSCSCLLTKMQFFPNWTKMAQKVGPARRKTVTEISREHWSPGEVWGLFTKGQLLLHKQVLPACLLFVKFGSDFNCFFFTGGQLSPSLTVWESHTWAYW